MTMDVPAVVPARRRPDVTAALTVGAVVVAALYFGRELFVPLALAILLSFALSPLVVWLRRIRIPRAPAVLIVAALAFTAIASVGAIMGKQLAELAAELPRYEQTLRTKIQGLQSAPGAPAGVIERATEALEGLSRELEGSKPEQKQAAGGQTADSQPRPIPVEIHQPPVRTLEYYQNIIMPMLGPLARTGLVGILVIFMLFQREDLRDRFIRLFGGEDFERTTTAMNDAATRLSRLFLTLTVMNVLYGLAMAAALWVIGIPNPILWGILAGLMRYVPYIGSIIAALFPVLLAAAVDPGWSLFFITLAVYVVGEFAMGQIMEPWLRGNSTGLSPLAIVASASFWTWIWGPVGLLLAIPLTVCLIVLGRHVPQLNFLYVMLGDQPALTPPQRFYQRLLAGDIGEVTFDAEQYIKKHGMVRYYDEVTLPGLVLAQADARRGRFGPERLNEMLELVEELVEELDDEDLVPKKKKKDDDEAQEKQDDLPVLAPEELPEAWRTEAPVLCVAVRSPLDQAAAAILAQLATKHGLGAKVLDVQSLTPANVRGIDFAPARVAALSHLDDARSPAYLRFLIRRLRRRQPELPILIAAWDAQSSAIDDTSALRADNVKQATTLRETLAMLLAAARKPPETDAAAEQPDAAASPELTVRAV